MLKKIGFNSQIYTPQLTSNARGHARARTLRSVPVFCDPCPYGLHPSQYYFKRNARKCYLNEQKGRTFKCHYKNIM